VARTSTTSTFDRGSRRQAIVESLLADVFGGQLSAGQHLVTQDLAERYGVSHTPIREALIALAGIGIIDLLPNRGAVVRQVSAKDVREVCQVRRVLECEAIRRACGRIDLRLLEDLAREFTELAARKWSPHSVNGHRSTTERATHNGRSDAKYIERARALDSKLHDAIAAACHNDFLRHEMSRLKTLFRAFRDVSWAYERERNDFRRLAGEAREHLAIVEALRADDAKAAARAMSRHIRAGVKYWSRALPAVSGESVSRERGVGVPPAKNNSLSNGKRHKSRVPHA
jgi:DNA-binding GntR family transcriptional regulator